MTAQNRNASTSGQIDDGVPAKIPAEAGEESALLVEEDRLEAGQDTLESERNAAQDAAASRLESRTDKTDRNGELRQLQNTFDLLRANGTSTADALRQVAEAARNPETQRHLNALLSKVVMLQTALPDKPEVVNRLLNTNGINLAAATIAGSFASFMSAAETDDALNEADRTTLRQIINTSDRQLRTGTQVRNTALATTIDPATGHEIPLHPESNKAEVAPGVYTFTETGQNVVLEINEGNLHRQIDVTGLDGQSVGIVAEIMGVAALAESCGAGGFIKHVYHVDFDRFAEQGIDPISLCGISRKLTHLMNTGHDGEILQPQQQRSLLETQMRLVSPTGSLLAWEDDPDGYAASVEELGLDQDAVLEAFGRYTQINNGLGTISREELQRHLHRQFPNEVVAPDDDEGGDLAA